MEKIYKRCRQCGSEKPINAFSRDNSRADGRQNNCRSCQSEISRERYKQKMEAKTTQIDEKFICYLDTVREHRLTYDQHQWIVEKNGGRVWYQISFIGSDAETLLRNLKWKQIEVTDEARRLIKSFPKFLVWIDQQGDRAANLNVPQMALRA